MTTVIRWVSPLSSLSPVLCGFPQNAGSPATGTLPALRAFGTRANGDILPRSASCAAGETTRFSGSSSIVLNGCVAETPDLSVGLHPHHIANPSLASGGLSHSSPLWEFFLAP